MLEQLRSYILEKKHYPFRRPSGVDFAAQYSREQRSPRARVADRFVLTLEFLSGSFDNGESLKKLALLVQAYILRGGHQLQLNAVDAAVLKDAQAHPEKYDQLVVRVWGWSAYFVERADYVIMDLKLADSALHRQYTGADNRQILENFAWLRRSGKPHVVRVPLIPGITDGRENLKAIARIAGDAPVQLLQYNPLAPVKYGMLRQAFPLQDLPAPEEVDLSIFHEAQLLKL